MSSGPLLPSILPYVSEKEDLEAARLLQDERCDGGDSTNTRTKSHRLSIAKRTLLVVAALWLTAIASRAALQACHRHKWNPDQWYETNPVQEYGSDPELFPQPAENDETLYFPVSYSPSVSSGTLQSANGTVFATLDPREAVYINFVGATASRVIISRGQSSHGSFIVESTWGADAELAATVNYVQSVDAHLLINAADASSHTVHLYLPSEDLYLPRIIISSTTAVSVDLDSSASDVHFAHFSAEAGGDIQLPPFAGREVSIAAKGDIAGSFNVTRSLELHTSTGNINATVHAVPLHRNRPPHKHPKEPKGPKKPKGPNHPKRPEEDDEEPEITRRWFLFGRPRPRPHFPPPHHRPPPPPVRVSAQSGNGNVELHIHKPPFVSIDVFAKSASGDVKVFGEPAFHGAFKAGSRDGNVEISAGPKEIHIVSERVTDTGRFVQGFVEPNPTHRRPPHHPKKDDEDEDESAPESDGAEGKHDTEPEQEILSRRDVKRRHVWRGNDDNTSRERQLSPASNQDRHSPPPHGGFPHHPPGHRHEKHGHHHHGGPGFSRVVAITEKGDIDLIL